jgi:hypothetical protein
MWYFMCLVIGTCVGALATGLLRGSSHEQDCRSCKSYYMARIRALEDAIHGLKSAKGKLAKEVQDLTFRNSGYNAR